MKCHEKEETYEFLTWNDCAFDSTFSHFFFASWKKSFFSKQIASFSLDSETDIVNLSTVSRCPILEPLFMLPRRTICRKEDQGSKWDLSSNSFHLRPHFVFLPLRSSLKTVILRDIKPQIWNVFCFYCNFRMHPFWRVILSWTIPETFCHQESLAPFLRIESSSSFCRDFFVHLFLSTLSSYFSFLLSALF